MNPLRSLEDALWARRPEYAARVASARSIVRDAITSAHRPYVAWSTGKDSTVLLHLATVAARELELDPPLAIYMDAGAKLPGTDHMLETVPRAWGVSLRVVTTEPLMDTFVRMGGPLAPRVEGETMRTTVWTPVRNLRDEGFETTLVGVRAEESSARAAKIRRIGHTQYEPGGARTVSPLHDWRVEDVWAYTTSQRLPYHPAYDLDSVVHRNDIRTSYWCGESGVSIGRWYWLRVNYPHLFNEMVAKFPEVAAHA